MSKLFEFFKESPLAKIKKLFELCKEKPMMILYILFATSIFFDIIKYIMVGDTFDLFIEVVFLIAIIYFMRKK
jgi:hypothetical protein